MFYDVSRCFTMYHNVLHVFHDVLLCLTMFYDVQRVAQRSSSLHRAIGDRAAADRLRDRDNAAGIGDNRRNRRWRRRDRRYRRERDPTQNSVLNGDWSNSVPGKKNPNGELRPRVKLYKRAYLLKHAACYAFFNEIIE